MINLGLENVPALKKNPLPFLFAVNNTAMVNTLTETSTTPAGYEGAVTAYVTGNDAQIRRNNTGAWGSSVALSNGDLLNLQMTSSPLNDTQLQCTVIIGATSTIWTLRTIVDPGIVLTNIVNAPISKVFTQSTINRSNVPLTFTITGGQISADNVTWGTSALIQPGATFWVRQTSSPIHTNPINTKSVTATLSVLGTLNYYWTISNSIVTPDAFTLGANTLYTIPAYDTLIVQAWGAGGPSADTGANGIDAGPTLFGNYMSVGSGKHPTSWNAIGAAGAPVTGGDINTIGYAGYAGGYGASMPAWNYAPSSGGGLQGAGKGGSQYAVYDEYGKYLYSYSYSGGGTGGFSQKTFVNNALPEGSVVDIRLGVTNYGQQGLIAIFIYSNNAYDFTNDGTFTVPNYTLLRFRVWGGGGLGYHPYSMSKDVYNSPPYTPPGSPIQYYGHPGTDTIIASLGLIAGGGGINISTTIGGAGGIGSGGDVNITGNPGLPGPTISVKPSLTVKAPNAGNKSWGEGSPGSHININSYTDFRQNATGGTGAYVEKTYTAGQLVPGTVISFTVGKGGWCSVGNDPIYGGDGHIQVIID